MRHKVQNMLDQNGEFISRFDELNINSEYFSENTLFTNLNRQRVRGFKKNMTYLHWSITNCKMLNIERGPLCLIVASV